MFAQRFTLGVRGFARDADWFFKNHFTPGKRDWDLKAVPTVQADFPVQMIGDRNDGQAGDLGGGHDAVLYDIAGTARSIWSEREIIAALRPGGQFEQGLRTAPAGGTANRLHFKAFQHTRQKSSVFARAD